jgi:glycosyltransferase involved in cell wall biosynthesis
MKILFLCNKSPWPAREGGPMAMNMLIEGLANAGHKVKVLAVNSFKYNINPADIPDDYRMRTNIEFIDVDLHVKPFNALLNLFTGKSYHVQRFISKKFNDLLIRILTNESYDVVQLETLFMCPYIETIRNHSEAKIILRAHNIEHLIWQRIAEETGNPLKKWYIRHLAHTLKKFEQDTVLKVDGILAITPPDAAYFTGLAGRFAHHPVRVIDLPFGIDPSEYHLNSVGVEFPSLFSLGSMNWIPNQEGIKWFLHEVWPDVHRQFPALKYYLAGREMPEWMRLLKLPNVVVLGEIPDAREFLASKAIMIVPLFSGSGIRVKIIEGMAAGKTIISTSIGAEGIRYTHRENILIADAPCEFFEMISICATDKQVCDKIGQKARMLTGDEYDTGILIRKLIGFYEQVR